MGAVIKEVDCAWCGAPFFADKRHKYCSEECATEAHHEQARVRFRRRYAEKHERELERTRDYYRRNTEAKKAKSHEYYLKHKKEAASND